MNASGRIRIVSIWIGLVAYLVIALGNVPGFVFCCDQDGRFALETAIDGVCSDAWKDVTRTGSMAGELLPFKHCTDIPVGIGNELSSVPHIQTYPDPVQDAAMPKTANPTLSYLASATETVLPQPPPVRPVIHQFLSTVVLLL